MRLPYQTLRDPELPHQVVIFLESGNANIHVSCNCNWNPDLQNHKSFGVVHDISDSRRLYNDAANHLKPFTEQDRAKW